MLTLSMIFTAASLIMHGVSYLFGSNDTVKEVTKVVDTGTALAGGTVAAQPRGTTTAATNQTVTVSKNAAGQTVRDHRG